MSMISLVCLVQLGAKVIKADHSELLGARMKCAACGQIQGQTPFAADSEA